MYLQNRDGQFTSVMTRYIAYTQIDTIIPKKTGQYWNGNGAIT